MFLIHKNRTPREGRRRGARMGPILAAALLAMAAVAGCRSQSDSSALSSAPVSTNAAIATVNGDPITMGELYDTMQRLPLSGVAQAMQSLPQGYNVGHLALLQLIQQTLVIQFAKDQGVPVTNQEIDQDYQESVLNNQIQTSWPYDQVLALQGYTPDTYKRDALRFQIAEFNLVTKGVSATPQEIQAAYNADKATRFKIPAAVHIERVIVPTKDQADSIYQAASQGKPLSQFQSESQAPATLGSDPVEVPQWLELDPSPSDPNYAAIATITGPLKSAKAGQVVKPYQVGSDWWVVKVLSERPESVLPFDEVKDAVRSYVLTQKVSETDKDNTVQQLKDFNQRAVIIVPTGYQDIVQQIKSPAPPVQMGAPQPAPAPSAPKK